MSTRSSYFLTVKNEHWYHDCSDYTNVMEIELENIESIDYNFDTLDVFLKENTELYFEIKKQWKRDFYLSIPFKNIENYEVNKKEQYVIIITKVRCDCDYDDLRKRSYDELNDYIKKIDIIKQNEIKKLL